MRIALTALAALLLAAAPTAAAAPVTGSGRIPVTFVGDSVSEAIAYVPAAKRTLGRGLAVRFDAKVCRRLVQPSCTFQGTTPTTALQVVRASGGSLGRVLVVDVGYNEGPQGYGSGIDRVMHAALAQGADGVVWVTLREQGRYASLYHGTNLAIRSAAKRWHQLLVADWNAYSAGEPWFGSDGLHLTPRGAVALAGFIRPYVLRTAEPN